MEDRSSFLSLTGHKLLGRIESMESRVESLPPEQLSSPLSSDPEIPFSSEAAARGTSLVDAPMVSFSERDNIMSSGKETVFFSEGPVHDEPMAFNEEEMPFFSEAAVREVVTRDRELPEDALSEADVRKPHIEHTPLITDFLSHLEVSLSPKALGYLRQFTYRAPRYYCCLAILALKTVLTQISGEGNTGTSSSRSIGTASITHRILSDRMP
ncbi:hypothetical protein JAAARDRAFT_256096 [Jaapia argillacea MUCL 33604]|uniref:Uncharacterized protein n=1 Tax=Jaapia argillacea MUCL 33604 TaxID=933084 RepID=A0A067Q3K6_9AGAM|nr:hypothetical protein JAAARDRAFT_256096 [Jaapia argillacea MUCL 33604]